MRVLFINPFIEGNRDHQVLPLGLLSIATAAKNDGHTVMLIDRMISSKNIKKEISEFKPDIIGLSFGSARVLKDIKMISEFAMSKNICVVCGGIFASLAYEAVLNDNLADIVSIGEGEGTWCELLQRMDAQQSYSDIDGIAYRENGAVKRNPDRAFLPGDQLPVIDFSMLNIKKYLHPYHDCERMTFLYSSKGCNGCCTFCFNHEFNKSVHRKRPMEIVLKEIKYLADNYGLDGVYFADELWCTNKADIKRNCEIIMESGIKFVWGAMLRIGMLEREELEYLYKAGCRWIYYGIESGSPERLKAVKKNVDVDRVLVDVKNCYEVGITVWSSVIVGYPNETQQELQMTVDLCKKISKYAVNQCFLFAPTLGSEIFNELLSENKIERFETMESLTRFIWDRVGENYTKVPVKDLYVVSTYILWWAFTFQTSSRGNTKHGFTLGAIANIFRTLRNDGINNFFKVIFSFVKNACRYVYFLFLSPKVKKKYGLKLDKKKFFID